MQPCVLCFCIYFIISSSQFTVLNENALSELVPFFENLLVVDVGHGGDEALEEEQDVAHAQRAKPPH